MMYIGTIVDNDWEISIGWHVCETKPTLSKGTVVTYIQADGDELIFVLNQFDNLPHTKGRVQIWRGIFAQFIYDNLPV